MKPLLPALVVCVGALAAVAWAQTQPVARPATPAISAPGKISWASLDAEQKTALRPLANTWPTLSPEQQRKWVALAHNFSGMSAAEQGTLQGRMTEWAALSVQQRTQARLNFGETRKLPAGEKKAKWEQYQSLSAEDRKRLAESRPKPPVGTAPALQPVSPDKILRSPGVKLSPQSGMSAPARPPVNRNTLLPNDAFHHP